jgi:hypothetical protein
VPQIANQSEGLHPLVWKITTIAVLGSFISSEAVDAKAFTATFMLLSLLQALLLLVALLLPLSLDTFSQAESG